MIVLYAEKEDMGIKYAAALGGIRYKDKTITTDSLPSFQDAIKKEIANKYGYIKTRYNGKDYTVTWGWGHFGTLKDIKDYEPGLTKWRDVKLPYFPKKFEVKRRPAATDYFQKRDDRQFEIIKKLFNDPETEYIINGTDWEREGELIFAYVYDLSGSRKPYKRLRSNSKTETQIRKDFSRLVSEQDNYSNVVAARGRGIADWTVGINMTIAASLYLSKDGKLLNVGRVLTPTLALITDRENEILNFVESTNYGLSGSFRTPGGKTYDAKCDTLYKTKAEAEDILGELPEKGTIESIETKTERKKPPLLHNTQSLQIEANSLYGYTLEDTLKTAQSLYEAGYLTYPRVDSQYLTEDKIAEMPNLLRLLNDYPPYRGKSLIKQFKLPDRYYDNKKVDGHDAIITTDVIPKSLNEKEAKIYDLVARRMIMATMPDAVIEKTQVVTNVISKSGEIIEFKSNGTKYKEKGFMTLLPGTKKLEDTELPPVTKGMSVSGEYSIYEQVSKPPARFTDGTLIKAMENCGRKMEDPKTKELLKKTKGIGRPATRAAIMEKLVSAGYVERKGKTIYPTEKGMHTIKAITIDEIKSPILTADWEEKLDEIEQSDMKDSIKLLNEFISDIKEKTGEWCDEMQKNQVQRTIIGGTGIKCPLCGKEIVEGKDNYYCSGYRDGCSFSLRKEAFGKKVTKKILEDLCKKGKTGILNGFKSKAGKDYSAGLVLKDLCICPSCGKYQPSRDGNCYYCHKPVEKDPKGRKTIDIYFENKERK